MLKKLLPSLGLAVLGLLAPRPAALAQAGDSPRPCSYDLLQQQYFATHPSAERDYYDLLRQASQLMTNPTAAQRNALLAAPDVTVPVVVHVLYTGPASNITDRQINDAMAVANTDFRKHNADTAAIIPVFRPLIANVGFQFRLAKKDPNGNCTTGITRTNTIETNFATAAVTSVIYWDPRKYLNVWIVDDVASGAGGYTFGGAITCPQNDGIVLRSSQFGPNTRCSANLCTRSFTHEIGHYFGLPHTWGPTNTPGLASNCGFDDGIADTPNTAGYSQAGMGPCNTAYAPCRDGNNQPILSNVQNFMDYADCQMMFTLGQRAVMRAAVTNSSCRANMVSQANLVATGTNDGYVATPCAPIASFVPSTTTVCVGSPVSVRDYSYNFTAAGGTLSYNWSFPGGTPATATGSGAATPVTVTYATPGFYTITETVTNSVNSNVSTRTNLIRVEGAGGGESAPLVESFENSNFPSNFTTPSLSNWETLGTSSTFYPNANARWIRQASPSLSPPDGVGYVEVRNFLLPAGTISTLISPNINLSTVQSALLTFSRAYALRNASDDSSLRISFSSDCGNTWSSPVVYNATALSTQGNTPMNGFRPMATTDWQPLIVPIPAQYQGRATFKVRLQMFNGTTAGNYFHLDNLRISGPLGTRESELAANGISVFPNPLTDETAVHVDLKKASQIQVSLTDVLGREVQTLPAKNYSLGQQTISLTAAGNTLPAGMYVVRIAIDGKTYTSKLTVK